MQTMHLKRFLKIKEEKFVAGGGNGIKSTLFVKVFLMWMILKSLLNLWQYHFCRGFFGFWFLFFVFGCEAHGIKPIPLALRAHFSTGKRASYFHDDAMRQCIVLKGIPHSRPSWTCECDIISQTVSCKCNQVKMNPNSTPTILKKKRKISKQT